MVRQTQQTRLMESVLDHTLFSRTMMELHEIHPERYFYDATEILEMADGQRDTGHYPRVVQTWEFLRKYVTESGRLDWSTEPARRATMRDVKAAAEDCGISNAVITPQAWSALVCMMNMPEKLQEALNKKLETENSAAIYSDLVIPTRLYLPRQGSQEVPQ